MKKIALLYICTGKYTVFWDGFYKSFEKNFLPNCEKHYFVYTDAHTVKYAKNNTRIHIIEQEALPWPYPTLLRFAFFLRCEQELKEFDYIFFVNANMAAVNPVTEEMVLPQGNRELVMTVHPAYFSAPPAGLPYERNPHCSAFVPGGEGRVYVMGGFNGGTAEAYLSMCHTLADRIQQDLQKDVIARWHDESHLNRYLIDNASNCSLLPPSFGFPAGWMIPFKPILIIRDKKEYLPVDKIKQYKTAPDMAANRMDYCKKYFMFLYKTKYWPLFWKRYWQLAHWIDRKQAARKAARGRKASGKGKRE